MASFVRGQPPGGRQADARMEEEVGRAFQDPVDNLPLLSQDSPHNTSAHSGHTLGGTPDPHLGERDNRQELYLKLGTPSQLYQVQTDPKGSLLITVARSGASPSHVSSMDLDEADDQLAAPGLEPNVPESQANVERIVEILSECFNRQEMLEEICFWMGRMLNWLDGIVAPEPVNEHGACSRILGSYPDIRARLASGFEPKPLSWIDRKFGMNRTDTAASAHILDLPFTIRERIFMYAFDDVVYSIPGSPPSETAILRTCHLFRREARFLMFSQCIFLIREDTVCVRFPSFLDRFSAYINEFQRIMVYCINLSDVESRRVHAFFQSLIDRPGPAFDNPVYDHVLDTWHLRPRSEIYLQAFRVQHRAIVCRYTAPSPPARLFWLVSRQYPNIYGANVAYDAIRHWQRARAASPDALWTQSGVGEHRRLEEIEEREDSPSSGETEQYLADEEEDDQVYDDDDDDVTMEDYGDEDDEESVEDHEDDDDEY